MSTPNPPQAELLQKVESNIRKQGFTTLTDRARAGVYLFFSFDLVNSTQFKASYPQEWPLVVQRFYELVENELSTRLSSAIVWKHVGDEVLLYKRLLVSQDLYQSISAAYDALISTTELLHKTFPISRELLAVKGAVWIAEAKPAPSASVNRIPTPPKNIIVETGRQTARTRDFLGPQIDIGFRISQFALRRRLVISAELACLLYRFRTEFPHVEEQIRVVSYEILKGVWNGRHYPILWFERDWNNLENSFLYDEYLVSDLARSVKNNNGKLGKLKEVEKIFTELGRDAEIASLREGITTAAPISENEKVEIEIPQHRYAEVHCVAVCFSPDGKILAARRPGSKRRYPNCFEFGCGQLQLGESFGDCLHRAYKEDFGVELILEDSLKPLITFDIRDKDEQRVIPGVVFVAEISNVEDVSKNFSKEKHSEIRWLDPRDLTLEEDDCVPNFSLTCNKAYELWRNSKEANKRTNPNLQG